MTCPNVLLVILDSLRAKNMSLHGYYRETTPFLSKYADQATVYRQARSPSIHSVASHASMWTGIHVEEHQAIHHESMVDPEKTVWSDLQREGYETGLFTKNTVVNQASNLAAPFETTVTDRLGKYRGGLRFDAFDPHEEQVEGGAFDLL